MQDAVREEAKKKLAQLTNKKDVFLVDSFETAISLLLNYLKDKKMRLLIPSSGSYIPKQELLEETGLAAMLLPINKITVDDVVHEENIIILASSMPAFAFHHDFSKILSFKKLNNIIIINDATGSIGNQVASVGDFIIGDFSKQPLKVDSGAFIATNEDFKTFFRKYFKVSIGFEDDVLFSLLVRLEDTRKRLIDKAQRIKKDLNRYDIQHKFSEGWNVLIKASGEEKETLIKYCKEHNYQYVMCPKQEYMMDEGICIK